MKLVDVKRREDLEKFAAARNYKVGVESKLSKRFKLHTLGRHFYTYSYYFHICRDCNTTNQFDQAPGHLISTLMLSM